MRPKEKAKRLVKGLSIRENTMDALNNLFDEYEYMYKAEVVELLIELYFRNNTKKQEALPFIKSLNKQVLSLPD
jgi:hypothetical protein